MWTRGAQGSRENSHLLPQLPDIDEKFLRGRTENIVYVLSELW